MSAVAGGVYPRARLLIPMASEKKYVSAQGGVLDEPCFVAPHSRPPVAIAAASGLVGLARALKWMRIDESVGAIHCSCCCCCYSISWFDHDWRLARWITYPVLAALRWLVFPHPLLPLTSRQWFLRVLRCWDSIQRSRRRKMMVSMTRLGRVGCSSIAVHSKLSPPHVLVLAVT